MDIPKIEIPTLRAAVLIVDDTPDKLLALAVILSRMELEVVTATSGKEALRQLLKRTFALILLDVYMPTMDGLETAKLIRSHPNSAYTPIIFVTAEASSEGVHFSGYTLGAVDFIYSPIIPEILRAKVQVFADIFYLQHQVMLHNEHLESLVAQRTAALTEEITERKRAETELLQFKNVLDNTLDMIFMFEPESLRLVYVNQGTVLSMGYSREELLEMMPCQIQPLVPEPEFRQLIAPLIEGEQSSFHFETVHRRKDGTDFPVDIFLQLVEQSDGNSLFVAIVHDITIRKEAERALILAKEVAEQANKVKSEFVSTVSHELRTPLTAIAGALSLINGGVLGEMPQQMREMIALAHRNTQRLTHMVNDLLDIDKLTAGQMAFDLQTQALMPLIEQALAENRPYGTERGVILALTAAAPDAEVSVDSQRLMQAMSNLLSNAIKYSPDQGTVEIAVEQQDAWVRVSVKDRGPGIPAEFYARIFQKFSQADSSDTRQKGGTGLGLAIAREMMGCMGGTIGFESVEGAGATFFIELSLSNRKLDAQAHR